jgi:FkbM family methyltransferase
MDWCADNGDLTHRLNYDLDCNSVVIDLGGYRGDWTEKIFSKYNCNVNVFEPSSTFYEKISERFKGVQKIKVYNYGLGSSDSEVLLSIDGDASSIFTDAELKEKVIIKEANNFLSKFKDIDLIKINIEGAEYDLMEYLLQQNMVSNIKNLQIQFHQFIDNSIQRRCIIQEKLSKTHKITYNYDFIWENWEKI